MTTRAESRRLEDDRTRLHNWKRWGPYLAERQWSTVREDYSPDGECWGYFTHDHARSRTYRWGEDGLLGVCDRECRAAFALALWNERDPILKERLFGLTSAQGNHGEDVKECYFYLDSTPTHSYMKALYKYPQAEFPYARLIDENAQRSREEPELDLQDTGVFDEDRYFDVFAEYAKGSPNDLLVRITVVNRGPEAHAVHVIPQLWLRNTWAWGRTGEGYWPKGKIRRAGENRLALEHVSLGKFRLEWDPAGPHPVDVLFTENETNRQKLWGVANQHAHVKDAFHECVVNGRRDAVNAAGEGTKAGVHYRLEIPAQSSVVLKLRLVLEDEAPAHMFGEAFDRLFGERAREADEFYGAKMPANLSEEERRVGRQAYAGLLWSKQFYHYVVKDWLEGDPGEPKPPAQRLRGRNHEWDHLYAREVLSMPDKWEYPWYAAWDLAFHMPPFARVDPDFAREQLLLLLREWYMHPNGQLPAYEFEFSDVNPPVHAWAAWRVYRMAAQAGERDTLFLERVFQKLLINFTWWVNRKDTQGNNLFSGGFLGMDNVGVFNRSRPLPTGGHLAQADGTAWMAFYCATMLTIALELAKTNAAYEDMASKFFEHFVAITDAMNEFGGTGLWHEGDGFYYDQLVLDDHAIPLAIRSMVGLIPLFAVSVIDQEVLDKLPGFSKRMNWFLENRKDLSERISYMQEGQRGRGKRLLAIPSRERLVRVLRYLLDEKEFLSPYGVRSLSRVHKDDPYVFYVRGEEFRVGYVPGESDVGMFGGNSNWRGPIWMPVNVLLVEALERYHGFYGDSLTVECPTGSGRMMTLRQVAHEIASRLTKIFLPDASGHRPCFGDDARFAQDPNWRELVWFHEYFDGDTGRGCGACHQTGWTALVVRLLEELATTAEK